MTALVFPAASVILLVCLVAGLWRVLKGPTDADRMLAAQLFGTVAVAVLVLLPPAPSGAGFLDVALAFALLAAVAAIAFIQHRSREAP